MDFLQRYKKLCTPAAIYFTISALSLILIGLQNISNPGRLCLGTYDCPAPGSNNIIVFIVHAVYILLVTYILNLICKDNNEKLSWFLVLFPIILMFIFYGITIMQMNSTKEGLEGLEEGVVEEYDSDDEEEGNTDGPIDEEEDDQEILTEDFTGIITKEGFEGMSSPDTSSPDTKTADEETKELEKELKELQEQVAQGFESLEDSKAEEPGVGHHEGFILEGNEDLDDAKKEIKELKSELRVSKAETEAAENDADAQENAAEAAEAAEETAAANTETAEAKADAAVAEADAADAENNAKAQAEAANMVEEVAEGTDGFEPIGADANIFG